MENSVQPILRNPTTECRATKIHTRRMQSWEVAKCGERLHKDVVCGMKDFSLRRIFHSSFSLIFLSVSYPFAIHPFPILSRFSSQALCD